MKHLLVGVLISAALVAVSTRAVAGTVFTLKTETVGSGGGEATVYLDKTRLRIDSNEKGKDYTVIFQSGGEDMRYWMIDHGAKTYIELTPADMDRMRHQIEESMKSVEKQLHTLPPARRAEVEKAYRKQLGIMGRGGDMLQYKEIAKGAKAGKWSATQYTGYMGEEKVEEVWAATWDELGAPRDDFKVVVHMAEMFASAGQRMPAYFQFGRIHGTDEFPVVVLTYENGQQKERSEVLSVIQQKIDESRFVLPKGLTKNQATPPEGG